jgi:3-oxoacid CoA-transferase
MIMSYVGTNKRLQDAYLGGEVALELSPQGTIAERLRAGGAGMPGVFTRTGAGTYLFGTPTRIVLMMQGH